MQLYKNIECKMVNVKIEIKLNPFLDEKQLGSDRKYDMFLRFKFMGQLPAF